MNLSRLILASLLFTTTAWAQTSRPSVTPQTRTVTYTDYRLILDRNIFSRDRRTYSSSSSRYSNYNSRNGNSRPALVLTGVESEGDRYTAFIEDRRSGTTNRYHVGDTVGERRITEIALDHILFAPANIPTTQSATTMPTERRVEVGGELTSGPVYVETPITPPTTNPTLATPGTSPVPGFPPSSFGRTNGVTPTPITPSSQSPSSGSTSSADPNDIVERLRQRRLQETKK